MPELPEVETVKRSLSEHIIGRSITGVTVHQDTVIKTPDSCDFVSRITGQSFSYINRRGKYLLFGLSRGSILVAHLRMTGRLVYAPEDEPVLKHTHVIFHLDNSFQLRFTDQRRFGCLWLVSGKGIECISGLCSLGPEPLGPEFTRHALAELLKGRKTKMKALLLDQRLIAGIGNIYADEILFHSGIHPERAASSLTGIEIDRLWEAARQVLDEAVQHRGTSFSDYVDGRGEKGTHQNHLKVYQREGSPCARCGSEIQRIKVGSRSSYYCSGCQK